MFTGCRGQRQIGHPLLRYRLSVRTTSGHTGASVRSAIMPIPPLISFSAHWGLRVRVDSGKISRFCPSLTARTPRRTMLKWLVCMLNVAAELAMCTSRGSNPAALSSARTASKAASWAALCA